jgi:glyoxylase-like metal-dependent hydrolase (beta-lactamase superfamily II)
MTPPAGHIAMLDITSNVRGKTSTIHPTLIWDDESAILVDAGFPGQVPLIRAAVEQAGVPFHYLDKVILTHHDLDHIGSLAAMRLEQDGKLKVFAHAVEKAYIDGSQVPLKLARMAENLDNLPEETKAFYGQMKNAFENSFTPVDQTLSDGEELPFCGGIIAIHTPGHTLGHICLYVKEHKTLIAGDTLTILDESLAMGAPAMNFDTDTARVSLQKLTHYDIQTVISYHGGQFQGNANGQIAALANGT